MTFRLSIGLFLAGTLLAGCLGPLPPKGSVGPRPTPVPGQGTFPLPLPSTGPVVFGEPVPGELPGSEEILPLVPVLWAPAPKSGALAAARYLAEHPEIRLTVFFPENYLGDDAEGRLARTLFQVLVASRQVEIAMTLPGRPVVGLLLDTDNGGLSVPPVPHLPRRYSWPQDVAEQIALARSTYRRRWKTDPPGIVLPWDVAIPAELERYAKAGLRWAVQSASGPVPVVWEGGAVPLFQPAVGPRAAAERKEWFQNGPAPSLAEGQPWGPLWVSTLEELDVLKGWTRVPSSFHWGTLSDAVALSEVPGQRRAAHGPPDYSLWIGESEENRAWELLGQARRAVEAFTNSGTAGLKTLDLTARAIHAAASGRYFYVFGQDVDAPRDADVRREFLESLKQVYQLMGETVPPDLRAGFSTSGGAATTGENDVVFEREGSTFRWRDPASDDRGPGGYFYPAGIQYEPGSWDLRLLEVQTEPEDVVFVLGFGALPNPLNAPGGFSFPLVDLYVDINRSPGAGSTDLLPGRPGFLESEDAWEYVLTVDGWGARWLQYAPGTSPRLLCLGRTTKLDNERFEVRVPRRWARGLPEGWGYGLVVMGRGPAGAPMPVGKEPSATQFGGAKTAQRAAPPYIDLLTPRGVSQSRVLSVYQQGQDPTLPFLRVD